MKTIEERAKEYASKEGDISLSTAYNEALARIYEESYIAGATEQLSIDMASLEECACGSDCRGVQESMEE